MYILLEGGALPECLGSGILTPWTVRLLGWACWIPGGKGCWSPDPIFWWGLACMTVRGCAVLGADGQLWLYTNLIWGGGSGKLLL